MVVLPHAKNVLVGLAVLGACSCGADAFNPMMSAAKGGRNPGALTASRRSFLSGLVASVISTTTASTWAVSNIDQDKYGDKELKLATVNRLRQTLRNKLLSDESLAPTFLKLAITDALGFDAQTTAGGPDGSVAFEMDRPENEGLKAALNACQAIQKDLKRTSEVSLSDVIAFAGGESLLAVGGPRIAVQLGRYDSKAANPAANIPGFSFEKPTSDGFKAAFKRSGLGGKEMALLLSAMGSVQDVVDIALKEKQEEEEDDLVDSSWEKNLPNSFGRPDEMYGARIGKADFGTSYITRILQKEKKNARDLNATDAALLSDQECRSYLLKYVGNEKAFGADVAEAYARLTLLGAAYESRMLSRE